MRTPDLTLYFITDSTGVSDEKLFDTVDKACRGGATVVQLREKNRSGKEYFDLACGVKRVTERYKVPLIIDDRADIALACGAEGVHVGSADIPVAKVREIMGKEKIVGATAKTVERALEAERDGADYLGVGAIYPTNTKVVTVITEVSTLKDICAAVKIPVCAIGGLNYDNCGVLEGCGISGIAVVSAIMKSDDPYMAAKMLKERSRELI